MQRCRLSDIATFSQGKQIPIENQIIKYQPNLNRFIRIVDYTQPSIEPRYTTENSSKYKVSDKDLVMIRYGSQTAGKVVRGYEGIIANNMFKINFKSPDDYDMNFMYFYLSSPCIYDFLMRGQVSSTMPAITFDMLSNVFLNIPEKEVQKNIGCILDNISKKIELNNKINAELEQMAKTLYDYWFIQFEFPDGNGGAYKSSNGPMTYNEVLKREIPVGWEVKKLDKICSVKYGKSFSNKDLLDEGYDVYGANGIIGKYSTYTYSEPKILIGCRGSVGNISYTYGKVFITHNSLILDDLKIGFEYLYYYCKSMGFNHLISGSVQPQLTIDNAIQFDVLVPEKSIVDSFIKKTHPLLLKKIALMEENRKLTELRDFLLPMLMNGQVSIAQP